MKDYSAVGLTILEQLLRVIAGIVIVGLVARSLGVEKFGLFQYAVAIVGFFSSFSLIYGNELLLPKLMKENNNSVKLELLENVFLIRIIAGFFSYISWLFYIYFFHKLSFDIVKYMGISIIFFEGLSVTVSLMQSKGDFFTRAIYGIVGVIIKFIAVLALYVEKISEINAYSLVWILDSIFIAILLYFYLKNEHINVFNFKNISMSRINQLKIEILDGFWVWSSLVGMFLYLKLDRFFGVYLLDSSKFGSYAAAAQLMDNVFAIVTVISPFVAFKFYKNNGSFYLRPKYVTYVFMILLSCCIVTSIFSPLIINIIFGEKYESTANLLSVLIFEVILFCFVVFSNIIYIWKERYKLIASRWIFAIVIWLIVSNSFGSEENSIIYANYTGLFTILFLDIIIMSFSDKGIVK